MNRLVAAFCVVGALDVQAAHGQAQRDIVGTWRLVSAVSIGISGERDLAPFGGNPNGWMIYTREGTMAALISHSDRSQLSADRIAAPSEERAAAFATFFSYAGTYTVRGDTLVHHVAIASVQNWVGTDLVRVLTRDRDRLVLRTPPLSVAGTLRTSELVWERVKPPAG